MAVPIEVESINKGKKKGKRKVKKKYKKVKRKETVSNEIDDIYLNQN